MANNPYSNKIIENELKEKLITKLNMSQFLTVDTSLTEADGMVKEIHRYSSTGTGAVVTEGNGNTTAIEMSYTSVPYTVTTYQARFIYSDEAMMKDSFLVEGGVENLAKDIVNEYNTKAVAEFEKATTHTVTSTKLSFGDFADAIAELGCEDGDEQQQFALINPASKAELRKNLADELKYVEAYARAGYVGSVCGIPVYTSKAVSDKKVIIANKKAVTAFMKKDTEVEQERNANTRTNTIYSRNVKVIALTNEDNVCIINF